jgi:membrane protein implicated in regulation of membrane protease activity
MIGESLCELLMVSAVMLVILDFFVQSDLLSFIAYIILSLVIVLIADLPLMYGIVLGVVVLCSVGFLHYYFFKKIISMICNKVIAPSVIEDEPLTRYIGQTGLVVSVEGRMMLRLEGDLVDFKNHDECKEGDFVVVVSSESGVFEVSKK